MRGVRDLGLLGEGTGGGGRTDGERWIGGGAHAVGRRGAEEAVELGGVKEEAVGCGEGTGEAMQLGGEERVVRVSRLCPRHGVPFHLLEQGCLRGRAKGTNGGDFWSPKVSLLA